MCYNSRMDDYCDDDFYKILESFGVSTSEYSNLFNETFNDIIESKSNSELLND